MGIVETFSIVSRIVDLIKSSRVSGKNGASPACHSRFPVVHHNRAMGKGCSPNSHKRLLRHDVALQELYSRLRLGRPRRSPFHNGHALIPNPRPRVQPGLLDPPYLGVPRTLALFPVALLFLGREGQDELARFPARRLDDAPADDERAGLQGGADDARDVIRVGGDCDNEGL
jgi:hypothetical protein